MNKEQMKISVLIGGKRYGLTILRHEEEFIRRAASRINELITKYKQRFSNDKTDDYLSMAALQLATELVKLENQKDISPVFDLLTDIEKDLDNSLS